MLQLDDKKVMLIGSSAGDPKSTVNYNSENNTFTEGPRLNMNRHMCGCAVFKSPMHDGRTVALVVGSNIYSIAYTSEILDFTMPGNEWEACKQT